VPAPDGRPGDAGPLDRALLRARPNSRLDVDWRLRSQALGIYTALGAAWDVLTPTELKVAHPVAEGHPATWHAAIA
jgi:hypothetical protein